MFDVWIDKYKTVRKPTERVAGYRYAPFGAVVQAIGVFAATNPFRFSSEYADDELGLVYYNYRHYNPLDGRWVNRDPIEEQGGLNLYGFVGKKPFFNYDYLGLFTSSDWIPFIGTFVNALINYFKNVPGQNSADYAGGVSQSSCCSSFAVAEADCKNANMRMFMEYAASVSESAVSAKVLEAMGSYVGLFGSGISVALILDSFAGAGVTVSTLANMRTAMEAANAANCSCERYGN